MTPLSGSPDRALASSPQITVNPAETLRPSIKGASFWLLTRDSKLTKTLEKIIWHPLVKYRGYFDHIADGDWLPPVQQHCLGLASMQIVYGLHGVAEGVHQTRRGWTERKHIAGELVCRELPS